MGVLWPRLWGQQRVLINEPAHEHQIWNVKRLKHVSFLFSAGRLIRLLRDLLERFVGLLVFLLLQEVSANRWGCSEGKVTALLLGRWSTEAGITWTSRADAAGEVVLQFVGSVFRTCCSTSEKIVVLESPLMAQEGFGHLGWYLINTPLPLVTRFGDLEQTSLNQKAKQCIKNKSCPESLLPRHCGWP